MDSTFWQQSLRAGVFCTHLPSSHQQFQAVTDYMQGPGTLPCVSRTPGSPLNLTRPFKESPLTLTPSPQTSGFWSVLGEFSTEVRFSFRFSSFHLIVQRVPEALLCTTPGEGRGVPHWKPERWVRLAHSCHVGSRCGPAPPPGQSRAIKVSSYPLPQQVQVWWLVESNPTE